uniref:HTH psq-type domain-containing protein n=1 Tax=Lygus hesperus TaxID=30085 RepID=A0A0A9YWK7_LYGHE
MDDNTPVLSPDFNSGGSNNNGNSNGSGGAGNNTQPSTPANPSGTSTDVPKPDSSMAQTPGSTSSNVKQECQMASSDNGLFEDFDDDFYQDDNSLQIDETGNAYSLTTPNVQLDCSPGENSEEMSIEIKPDPELYSGLQQSCINLSDFNLFGMRRSSPYTQAPYKQYSQQSLEQAIYDLQTGKFNSIRACARHHGIPMTTLRYRAKVMSFITKSA